MAYSLELLMEIARTAGGYTCDASPEAYEWSGVPAQGDLLVRLPSFPVAVPAPELGWVGRSFPLRLRGSGGI